MSISGIYKLVFTLLAFETSSVGSTFHVSVVQRSLPVKGNKNIRNLLTIIQSEIIKQTGTTLPDEILQLDTLIKEKDEEVRLKTLQV